MDFAIHLLTLVALYIPVILSLNLAMGWLGMLNLGHVAFLGIGAYMSAILTTMGFPFVIAFVIAGGFTALCGVLLLLAVRDLKGDYLALATLSFSYVFTAVIYNWVSVTNGAMGIPGLPRPDFFFFEVSSRIGYLILSLVFAAVVYFFFWKLTRSSYGTAIEATRDDEIGMQVLGKNTFKIKLQVFALSACVAGLSGALMVHYITLANPLTYALAEIIFVFLAIIIGGLGSLRGSVIATTLLVVLLEFVRFVPVPDGMIGPLRRLLYAVLIFAVLFFKPKGMLGRVELA